MPYMPSVQSNSSMSTAAAQGANFGNSVFIVGANYFHTATKPYYSMGDVDNDKAIPKESNAYRALQTAFSQTKFASPVYLGRRKTDSITLTPTVANNTVYEFDVEVYNLNVKTLDTKKITFTSSGSATTTKVVAGLKTAIGAASIPAEDFTVDAATDVVKLLPAAGRTIVITTCTSNLVQSFEVTESAAECYARVNDEIENDHYFVTSEYHDYDFANALATVVEATNSEQNRRQYATSSSAVETLTPLTDPATTNDVLGRLKEGEYTRSFGFWHQDADTSFPELGLTSRLGGESSGRIPGEVNPKFLTNVAVVGRDPATGMKLSRAQQGYIADRNCYWTGEEMGISFVHGGKNFAGNAYWTDLVQIKDWTDNTIQARLTTLLVNENTAGTPITMVRNRLNLVADVSDSVLVDGVAGGVFAGYVPTTVPENIRFEDQANRLLKGLKYTAYFASKVNFIIVDGNLTYKEEIQ